MMMQCEDMFPVVRWSRLVTYALVLFGLSGLAQGDESRVTIYHDEARFDASLSGLWDDEGRTWLTVPSSIRSESLMIKVPAHPELTARLRLNEASLSTLTEALRGRLVRLNARSALYDPSIPEANEGRIVSIVPLLIQRGSEVQMVQFDELSFDGSLIDALGNLELQGGTAGEPLIGQLSYAFGGLRWRASYDIFFDAANGSATLVLQGLIKNDSRGSFSQVAVDLIAGQPQRVASPSLPQPGNLRTMAFAEADLAQGSASEMRQASALLFHRFSWPTALDIRPGDEWLLPIRTLSDLPAELHYQSEHWLEVYGGRGGREPSNPLTGILSITIPDGLLEPDAVSPVVFPAGQAFVHMSGADLDILLGEDRIEPARDPKELKLKVGAAFDVKIDRQQMSFRRLTDRVVEIEMAIEVANQSNRTAKAEILERIPGDWRLLNVSDNGRKADAQTLQFELSLEPREAKTLTYKVNVRL